MSNAPLYLITLEDEDDEAFSTGVLLGKESAGNPEDAVLQLANKALDENTKTLSPKARVHLMRNLYKTLENDFGEQKLVIYPAQRSVRGGVDKYRLDDLQFDDS